MNWHPWTIGEVTAHELLHAMKVIDDIRQNR